MKTVLLLEDNLEFANTCIKRLLNNRFEVMFADNAEKAKQILLEIKIDILIIDLMLPPSFKIEGLNFYRYAIENYNIPAIFITSKSFRTTEIVAEAMKLGASDFLEKESSVFLDKLIFTVSNVGTKNIKTNNRNNISSVSTIGIYLLLFFILIGGLTFITYLITLLGLPFIQSFLVITTVTISVFVIIISSQLLSESKIKEDTWLKILKSRIVNFPNQLLEKLFK